MTPLPPVQCANCRENTIKQAGCERCGDAPRYGPDDTSVCYCGFGCQESHRRSHKDHCDFLYGRSRLLRAALILKRALLAYRETVYDLDLTDMQEQEGALYLHHNERDAFVHCPRGPFPRSRLQGYRSYHMGAALTFKQGATSMALLSPLARMLFEGNIGPRSESTEIS
ncbi:hypothetical protein BO70DRAFT_410194 [Aspergillus heteromorphus CBS 117.55]|uniref:Suppressor of anucleate metulae protein B n=1 Tax=Aspergillus heteromorphus CBS 117.55 TaxID=1448321 RepID=A0A317WZN6_9EURO|nr:uncharacterized protein BO70DRAFT_410194 [Aspergillus heteromorphus CBS 117.55]PWY90782.1 hypothetical protein BO70DRAFT_410194 [Aspergillus heteromorphus CBS 117.55]